MATGLIYWAQFLRRTAMEMMLLLIQKEDCGLVMPAFRFI
jgi:hypothetical protein